jgi:hypothetical protein
MPPKNNRCATPENNCPTTNLSGDETTIRIDEGKARRLYTGTSQGIGPPEFFDTLRFLGGVIRIGVVSSTHICGEHHWAEPTPYSWESQWVWTISPMKVEGQPTKVHVGALLWAHVECEPRH